MFLFSGGILFNSSPFLKISPDDVLLLVNRAQVYRHFQRDDQAMSDLEKAQQKAELAEANPESPESRRVAS